MNDYIINATQQKRPDSIMAFDLPRREQFFPSPVDWCSEVLYFLLPDRFSDDKEHTRQLMPLNISDIKANRSAHWSWEKWAESGSQRFQGGTLKGVKSKLDYLNKLGVTVLWIGPVLKQRGHSDDYHGYAIQDFMDVDPRFGTRQDLVSLVDSAHAKGIRVILDIIFNHSGHNWDYMVEGENVANLTYLPWNPLQPSHYEIGHWIDGNGYHTPSIKTDQDGVWPRELQEHNHYTRAGKGSLGYDKESEDIKNDHAEFRRTDFEGSYRDFNLDYDVDTLSDLARIYKYWIALTDCDGFRIDTLKHVPIEQARNFCGSIKEFALNIGKNNFFLVGEVAGVEGFANEYLEAIQLNLNACLDICYEKRETLCQVAKGLSKADNYFDNSVEIWDPALGSSRLSAHRHVTILNDHDHVYGEKRRFSTDAASDHQVVAGVAIQLFSLGIPCIYYGTEQAFAGPEPEERDWIPGFGSHDCFLRETMFGAEHPLSHGLPGVQGQPDNDLPGFGAFGTTGYHCFNETHPAFLRISHLIDIRKKYPTLRYGRQYIRQISNFNSSFEDSNIGELIAWSRILDDEELLCIVNSNGTSNRGADITVGLELNKPATNASFKIIANSEEAALSNTSSHAIGSLIPVKYRNNTAYVEIRNLGPSEVLVLSNRY